MQMCKINFQQFKVYASVSRKAAQTIDAREQFADMIYTHVNGIRAHALAMKIYESDGETEYSSEEVKLIRTVAEQLCVPGFIDGLSEQLSNDNNKSE